MSSSSHSKSVFVIPFFLLNILIRGFLKNEFVHRDYLRESIRNNSCGHVKEFDMKLSTQRVIQKNKFAVLDV